MSKFKTKKFGRNEVKFLPHFSQIFLSTFFRNLIFPHLSYRHSPTYYFFDLLDLVTVFFYFLDLKTDFLNVRNFFRPKNFIKSTQNLKRTPF